MKRGQPPDDAAPPTRARWPWWVALLASLVGLGLSIVLEQIHFRTHTDPGFHSFCAIDRTVNCDIVARSPYSVFFGVPVAAWGIFAYALATIWFRCGACSADAGSPPAAAWAWRSSTWRGAPCWAPSRPSWSRRSASCASPPTLVNVVLLRVHDAGRAPRGFLGHAGRAAARAARPSAGACSRYSRCSVAPSSR